ncbi:MAG: class I SAM-dependent methyltransferase, partial [Planctomycetota bacterium]
VIDREQVPLVLRECHRVLKEGGTIRVVVGDLAGFARSYTSALDGLEGGDPGAEARREEAVRRMFELMTRRRPKGTSEQGPIVRFLERAFRGDAVDQGEGLRWQYDEHSLGRLLREAGFEDVQRVDHQTSRIEQWAEFGLDADRSGEVYKPGSLYMEGVRRTGSSR